MLKQLAKVIALSLFTTVAVAQPLFADNFESTVSIDFTNDGIGPIPVTETKLTGNKITAKCTTVSNGICQPQAVVVPPVVPPVTPPQNCDITPPGWSYASASDNRVMSYGAMFPGHGPWTSPSWSQPVGSFTTATRSNPSGRVMTGQLLAFKGTVGTKNTNIGFAGSQPISQAGYGGGYPADYAAVSVSKCKGDIVPRRVGDGTRCIWHTGNLEGRLIFGPTASGGCNFPAGTDVWVTIWFPNRNAPVDPTKNGCVNANKCNVNVTVR